MNKKRKYLIIGGVASILIYLLFFRKGEQVYEVTIDKVSIQNITEVVSASGKVQPETEVKISSDVSGEVVGLYVKEGQEVKKGDLLIRINPDVYQSNVERMEASLNTSKANLASTKARRSQVMANFINAESNYERNKGLYEKGSISESEFVTIKSNYLSMKAELEATEQSIIASEFTVGSAEASLKEARNNLRKTEIYAPMAGTISLLNVELGERVVGTLQMTGTEMLRIANLDFMEINIDVNENDIIRISEADKVMIDVDAYPNRRFKGVVTEIANSASSTALISIDQVTNFEVKIRILRESYKDLLKEGGNTPFLPGMSASVEIQTNSVSGVPAVPIQLVTTRSIEDSLGNTRLVECVFAVENGKAEMIEVETGIQDDNYIQLLKGPSEDKELISGPYIVVARQLQGGEKVRNVE